MNLTTYLIIGIVFAMLIEFTDSKNHQQLKGKGIFPRLLLIFFWPAILTVAIILLLIEQNDGKNNNRRRPF